MRVFLHSLSTSLSHVGTFTVLGGIRKQLCEKLSKIPLGSVLDDNSGSYKSIIVDRVDSMETTLAHIVPEFTANILLPIVMFIYILTLDFRLGLGNLVGALIGLICAMVMFAKSKGGYELSVEKTKKLNDTAVEYINGIEVIKAFGKTGGSYEKFVIAAREGADVFIDWMRRCIWPQAGTMSFLPATFLGVLPIGLLLVKNGELAPENFITGIILSAGLITPLVVAFSYTDDILKMKTIFGEVTEILERDEMERPSELTVKPDGSDITLKDVRFTYKDKEVLHGINMEIKRGEVAAIVGPSGSGKSTIARLIDSLWDPDSGVITYGGVDIKKLPLDYYTGQISYVAQENYLFDMSVKENIRLGRAGATDEDVINAAKASGCHDFILGLENGYDTVVGGAGGHLSGGERQRICIARAMLKDAPVVILDEATAYTDPENEALVQMSVAKLIKGKTLIVIAHRLSTININAGTFLMVFIFMFLSTVGKTVINRFSSMLQTEGGYDTCAMKRIEIGEHLRYLPMGYFNDTSLGHITSVTTNTMEQVGDIATRAIMMVLQGGITTVVVALMMFIFDVRIGLISLAGILVFLLARTLSVSSWESL